MAKLMVLIIAFIMSEIADFYNYNFIFDRFIGVKVRKTGKISLLGIGIYVFLATTFFVVLYTRNIIAYKSVFFLYYLRLVPFLWFKYGAGLKIPVVILLFEQYRAFVALNSSLLLLYLSKAKISDYWLYELISSVLTIIFFILIHIDGFQRKINFKIWFANLSVIQYLLVVATLFVQGKMEVIICQSDRISLDIKKYAVVTCILVFALSLNLIIMREEKLFVESTVDVLKEQLDGFEESFDGLKQKESLIKGFRHDLKNMIISLKMMISDGKVQEAVDYLNSMQGEISVIEKKYDSGNYIVDTILNEKDSVASCKEISFGIMGRFPNAGIKNLDMLVLLANALDNAIEACEKYEHERFIHVESRMMGKMWLLIVKNSTNDLSFDDCLDIKTSKKDKENHGFGMMNMRRVVEKYHGQLNAYVNEEELFVLSLAIELDIDD